MTSQNFNQQRGGPYHGSQQTSGHKGSDAQRSHQDALEKWKPRIKDWIQDKIDKDTILFGEAFGKEVKDDGLTTSQIRNVFGELRRIQANGFTGEKTSFLMVKPKLAYAAKRQGAKGLDRFYDFFCKAYDAVQIDSPNAEKQFSNFMQLTEAVLAYHKYYGGQ